jgi:predicted nucleic acid-binding protein
MAKIFLDTNIFIDLVEGRSHINLNHFSEHFLFISPLSIHIFSYIYKIKAPSEKLAQLQNVLAIVAFDESITYKSLIGPTDDFEDNVQLHSCAQADCDLFITRDSDILKLGYFGKAKISSSP